MSTGSEEDDISSQAAVSQELMSSSSPQHSTYDGYVAESTDVRVNFTDLSLKAATSDPKILIFGSGLGSAGTTLNEKFPEKVGTKRQIVQNEYASLLLELGLIGIALAVLMAITICMCAGYAQVTTAREAELKALHKRATPVTTGRGDAACIYAIVIAYALSLLFFSGLPNAFHIYLIPPLLAGIIGERLAKPTVRRTSRK